MPTPARRRPAVLTAAVSAVFAVVAALTAAPAAADPLPASVRDALRRSGIPDESMAAVALPLVPWARAWRWQADKPMQPASTMKLVTSIVALDRLGPNHRGHTELRSAAPVVDGVLQGDLVLRGGADPELGVAEFWAMLVELRQLGIESVAGRLVVDRTLFRPARPDLGVPPFDESPEFAYNVIPDALQLADAMLPLSLRSDARRVVVSTVPPLAGIELTSRMAIGDRACRDWDDDWLPATVRRAGDTTTIELNGAFPANCTQRTALQLIDRQELTVRLFDTLWRGIGGRWSGQAVEAAAPAATRLLVRRESRPWGEMLRQMNKASNNARTRLLYLSLGLAAMADAPQATTAELADRAVRRWLAEHGIADDGLVLDNGSGLSRSERITPQQLAAMLEVAWHGRHAPELLMSLPVAGVDGTMRNRLKGSPAAGQARLKTGSLRNVAALAGIVADDAGRPWAVAAIVNDDRAAAARPALDAFVDAIARQGPHGVTRRDQVGPQGEGP